MLNATTFTYDGVFSGKYGLLVAAVNTENIQETSPFLPAIKATKTPKQKRFSFAGIEYEDMPRFQFSFMCEDPIPDLVRRELLTWLVGRNGFRKLQFHQPDYADYEFNCIFEETRIIFVNGECHGFVLTAAFDSHFCYGRPRKVCVKGDGVEYKEVTLINESDIIDDFTFPLVKFKAVEHFDDNTLISITNSSDPVDPLRAFEFFERTEFAEVTPLEEIKIDNELKIITSSVLGDRLTNFNRNWLRLVKGANKLKIRINGECTIECPTYVKIGF